MTIHTSLSLIGLSKRFSTNVPVYNRQSTDNAVCIALYVTIWELARGSIYYECTNIRLYLSPPGVARVVAQRWASFLQTPVMATYSFCRRGPFQ